MLTIKQYVDGIAFYKDKYEIAFYSRIIQRITYNQYPIRLAYSEWDIDKIVSIPVEDNIFIIKTIMEDMNWEMKMNEPLRAKKVE